MILLVTMIINIIHYTIHIYREREKERDDNI